MGTYNKETSIGACVYTRIGTHIDYAKYVHFYNNQVNVRSLIGQSAMGYCAGKPTEKLRIFWDVVYLGCW